MSEGLCSQSEEVRSAAGEDILSTAAPPHNYSGWSALRGPESSVTGRSGNATFLRITARARERLCSALGLWRGGGEPLADFAYEPFAQGDIARLREARLAVLEDR
jgi:Bacterial transcriptional activator domain